MPCAILLDDTDEIVIVKDAWVEKLNTAENRNAGMDVNKTVTFFYSQDKSKKADFQLRPGAAFHPERTGCYIGNVLNIYGELILNNSNIMIH